MKIELNEKSNLQWEDLNYGDVFIDNSNEVCMKVGFICDGKNNIREYVLELSSGELFDDYDMYDIERVVNCKLVKDED